MGLVRLSESRDAAEVPIAPNLPQGIDMVQGALHVVSDAADGAGRSKGHGKQSLKPRDREVAVLAGHL